MEARVHPDSLDAACIVHSGPFARARRYSATIRLLYGSRVSLVEQLRECRLVTYRALCAPIEASAFAEGNTAAALVDLRLRGLNYQVSSGKSSTLHWENRVFMGIFVR